MLEKMMKKKIGWNTRPATVKYEWQSRAEIDDSGWQDCPTYPNAILAFPERRYFSQKQILQQLM